MRKLAWLEFQEANLFKQTAGKYIKKTQAAVVVQAADTIPGLEQQQVFPDRSEAHLSLALLLKKGQDAAKHFKRTIEALRPQEQKEGVRLVRIESWPNSWLCP